jgi:hypothetical protein
MGEKCLITRMYRELKKLNLPKFDDPLNFFSKEEIQSD